jgi:hypothetical protein
MPPSARSAELLLAMGVLLALLLAVVGGLIAALADFVSYPPWLAATGALAFVLGVGTAMVIAYRDARRNRISIIRSLGRSLRTAGRWIFELM